MAGSVRDELLWKVAESVENKRNGFLSKFRMRPRMLVLDASGELGNGVVNGAKVIKVAGEVEWKWRVVVEGWEE